MVLGMLLRVIPPQCKLPPTLGARHKKVSWIVWDGGSSFPLQAGQPISPVGLHIMIDIVPKPSGFNPPLDTNKMEQTTTRSLILLSTHSPPPPPVCPSFPTHRRPTMSIRNALCAPCDKNPQKAIAYAWFTSIVMVMVAFICACAAAAHSDGDGSASLGFAAVWTVRRWGTNGGARSRH